MKEYLKEYLKEFFKKTLELFLKDSLHVKVEQFLMESNRWKKHAKNAWWIFRNNSDEDFSLGIWRNF